MKREKRKNKLITKNCLSSSLPTSSRNSFINSSTTYNNNNDIINNLLYNDNTEIKKMPNSEAISFQTTSSSSSSALTMDEILSIDNKNFQDNFNKIKLKQNRHKLKYYVDDIDVDYDDDDDDENKRGLVGEKLKLLSLSNSDVEYNDVSNDYAIINYLRPQIKCKSYNKQLWFLLYIIFYILYIMIGGYIFLMIESPPSVYGKLGNNTTTSKTAGTTIPNDTNTKFEQIKKLFLEKYTNVDAYELENLLNEIRKSTEIGGGAPASYTNLTNDIGWSFGEAFFFAGTTVTTIGYGHTPPISDLGKIFCIIYSIFGIPFTLVLISAAVERLLVPSNWLLGMLNSKLGHLYQPFNIRLLHLSIIVTLVGIIFFVVPAFVLKLLEPKWSTIDSFYYVFVSLTTIGFGDFIPDGEMDEYNRTVYKVLITVYLIFGIISLMLVVTIFCSIPQLNLGQLFTENGTGENEKLRLSAAGSRMYSGPSGLYIPQGDEEVRRAVVRIRPRGDDSPSPEDTTPMHARDIRVP